MIGNKLLLDTNIIAALLKGERSIAEKMQLSGQIYIPVIVIGELHYGALYSNHIDRNLSSLDKLQSSYPVVPINSLTTPFYASIKVTLRRKGKPIPEK